MKKLLIIASILFFTVTAWADSALQVDFILAGYRHPTTDEVLSGGKIYTYIDGTSTLSALWTDKDKVGTATNPFILDSSGKAEVFGDNIYKMEIYDSNDVLIETLNGVEYSTKANLEAKIGEDFVIDHKDDYTHIVYTSISGLRASLLTPFNDQKISVTGYYSSGDGGGSDLYWDASSTDADNNGTIFKVSNIATGRWIRINEYGVVNGKWFGAKGDGVDDTIAVQEAITYTESIVGELFYPEGVYDLTASISITDSIKITGIPGKTVFDMSLITSAAAFEILGSSGDESEVLTSSASDGDLTVDVADGSVFSEGDWCQIRSEAVTGAGDIRKGEIVQILGIVANTITFKDPLNDDYLTGDTATLDLVTFIEDVTFDGIKIIGGDTPADNHVGIFALFNKNLTIKNCFFKKTHDKGIRSLNNIGFQFINNRFEDILATGLGYGMSITYACQDSVISGNVGKRMRHLVTHGGGATYYGVPRRILIDGNTGYQSRDATFDAHSGGEDLTFSNNESFGSEVDGIIVNCSRAKITNNTVVGARRYGIFSQLTSLKPLDVLIEGNVIRHNLLGSRGIFVTASNAIYNTVTSVIINSNTITGGAFGIDVSTTQPITIPGISITNNNVRDGSAASIQIADCIDYTVSSNNIVVPIGIKGIQVTDSIGGVISLNTIRGETTNSNTFGINITDSTDNSITGNTVLGSSKGIFLKDTSDYNIIMGNSLRTCTTPLTPGAGANNIYETAASDPYNLL